MQAYRKVKRRQVRTGAGHSVGSHGGGKKENTFDLISFEWVNQVIWILDFFLFFMCGWCCLEQAVHIIVRWKMEEKECLGILFRLRTTT